MRLGLPGLILRVLIGAMALAPARVVAGGYTPTLAQYAHASWRVQDGDIGGAANGITQTKDGYLWVATDGGLERYDGTRFSRWKLHDEGSAYAVLGARDGSLWIGTAGEIDHLTGRRDAFIEMNARFNALLEDASGSVWTARSRTRDAAGGLCRIQGAALRCFGKAEGQACDHGEAIAQDSRGNFWLGSDSGLCRWRPGGGRLFGDSQTYRNLAGVSAVLAEASESVLVGFFRPGPHLGLQQFAGGVSKPVTAMGLSGESLAVGAVLRDRTGALWIGTTGDGIYRVVDGKSDHFATADGLSGDQVNGLYEDREGDVWAATSGGVDRFHAHAVTAISTRQGLSADDAAAVLARRDGSIWMGTGTGLSILRDGVITTLRPKDGLPGLAVTSMLEDHANEMWVGVDNDLTRYASNTFRVIRKPDGGKIGVILSLVEDRAHDIWALVVGRPRRLYRFRAGRFLDEINLPSNADPLAIATDPAGVVWIVDSHWNLQTYRQGRFEFARGVPPGVGSPRLWVGPDDAAILSTRKGLYFRRVGKWTVLDAAHGLPCDRVAPVVDDGRGSLWVGAQCGLIIIDKSSLDRWLDRPTGRLPVQTLDAADGARPGFASFGPQAAVSPDGRLWFATDGVVLTVDPEHLLANSLPPPVHIERIVADHRIHGAQNPLALPPRTRDLEIDYAGLSFVAPQKVRFRYRMVGVDKDWQDVETRRSAFYMNLPPGHYTFKVIASNNDGVWNTTGDSLAITILPVFYQTFWFRALMAALLVAMVWIGVRLRVRYVAAQIEGRFAERQAERVRIARELHDTLLQGFHGLLARFQVVADAIPSGSAAKPMMEAVLNRADEILVEGRDRVRDLRSQEDGGSPLLDELERLAFHLEREGSIPIDVRSTGEPRPLNPDAQREIVAIAREALTNAGRHSQATEMVCELTFLPTRVQLACTDNGSGIAPETLRAGGREGHWGLTGMQERARQIGGVLRIRSGPSGTRVELGVKSRVAYLRRRRSIPGA